MYINYSKTKLLTFGSAKALASEPATTKVKIDGNEIQSVRSYKYLGVILDPQLTFEEHVSKCLRNASYKLSILRKVRPLLNKGAALQVYKSMILPLVEYGDVLYGGAKNQVLKKLQVIQNKSLKLALGLPKRTPTIQIHQTCGIHMLSERRRRSVLRQAYDRVARGSQVDQRQLRTRLFDAPVMVVPRYKKVQPL